MRVDKETVVNLWDLPFGRNAEEGVEVLEDKIIDTGRWSIHHELTVKIKDKFYQTAYSVGATECQDERPWEYEDFIDFEEVHQVEKIVKVWERVA